MLDDLPAEITTGKIEPVLRDAHDHGDPDTLAILDATGEAWCTSGTHATACEAMLDLVIAAAKDTADVSQQSQPSTAPSRWVPT